ncbi:hypothetical protein BDC45DRAFT_505089 [Circinella umbellata]|nr:hypothetical protein BDC45DRAFT_505089 [Circinella umbellata]
MTEGPLDDIDCPLCQSDLSHLRFSYERQQHVEQCLLISTSNTTDNSDSLFHDTMNHDSSNIECDFDYCIFCGKCVTHLKGIRKDVHFSRCLDELEREVSNVSFAGQSTTLFTNLDICPCCHEFTPLRNKSVRQKITHMKQCMKRQNMTIQQLLQKLQWIQWDYIPEERRRRRPNVEQLQQSQPQRPKHIVQATISGADFSNGDNDDDDFSNTVIIHKKSSISNQRRQQNEKNDPMDEDLQLALALSKTEAQKHNNNKRRKGNSDATNIVSIDESRRLASLKLQHILKQEPISIRHQDRIEALPSSRIKDTSGCYGESLWKLASLNNINLDNHTFSTIFIRNINQESSTTT